MGVHLGFFMCTNLEVSIQFSAKNDLSFNGGKSQVLPQDTFLGNQMPLTPCWEAGDPGEVLPLPLLNVLTLEPEVLRLQHLVV